MATYSVWNWKTGRYDYFRTPTQLGYDQEVIFANPLPPVSKIGNTIEEVLRPLPNNAKYTGSGEWPVGEIAVIRSGGMGDSDSFKNSALVAGILIGCFVTLKFFIKK